MGPSALRDCVEGTPRRSKKKYNFLCKNCDEQQEMLEECESIRSEQESAIVEAQRMAGAHESCR